MELILTGLEKRFGEKEVLKGASYTFEKGKIYGLLGRNGAGKTTLFHCISGELSYEGGQIALMEDGADVMDFSKIGFTFASPVLPEFLTGYEFLKFYIDINKDKIRDLRTPEAYFEMIRMAPEDQHRLMKHYSHGMKNKMQMICFFITKPPVLLLDEPLTSFDVVVAHEMKEMLKEMKGEHIIIFSTHILQLAADICDEIVMLHHGEMSGLSKEQIHQPDFEKQVIQMLSEEESTSGEASHV